MKLGQAFQCFAMFTFVVFFIRYMPTPDDIEMYKSHKGDPNELHVVDQYMMEVKPRLTLTSHIIAEIMEPITRLIT